MNHLSTHRREESSYSIIMSPSTPFFQPYAEANAAAEGPGDRRPTALQVVEDCNAFGKLRGQIAVCSGCSSGIGVETARALYEAGMMLYLTARDIGKLEQVIDNIVSTSRTYKDTDDKPPRPVAVTMHLDSLKSVREGADYIRQKTDSLNLLINNAGVMTTPYSLTEDGFELQMATNHYAHFVLFHELKSLLLKGASPEHPSRVVNLTSLAHRFSGIRFDDMAFSGGSTYSKWISYGQSKTANIYMANSINRRFGSQNIVGLSVHPGVIETPLMRHMDKDDYDVLAKGTSHIARKNVGQGAATTVWAAISSRFDDVERGGQYLAEAGECPAVAAWTYDEEAEEKFWELSCEAVGVKSEL